MSTSDKVIVSCALTGAVTTKKHCPAIPYTPVEIAEEARRAYEAGATIVHIHARTDDGAPSWDAAVFARIMEETKARCPVLINWSTGGAGPMTSRIAHLAQRPAIAALNMGSMNYAKWSETKRDFAFKFVFANPFEDIIGFAKTMKEHGIKPEMECFDTGHAYSHTVLESLGLIERPYHFSFIMGVLGGIPAGAPPGVQAEHPGRRAVEGDRHQPRAVAAGDRRCAWAATSASASRTTSTCPTARWRRATATWWRRRCRWPSCRGAAWRRWRRPRRCSGRTAA
jgi:hypothetical protein